MLDFTYELEQQVADIGRKIEWLDQAARYTSIQRMPKNSPSARVARVVATVTQSRLVSSSNWNIGFSQAKADRRKAEAEVNAKVGLARIS